MENLENRILIIVVASFCSSWNLSLLLSSLLDKDWGLAGIVFGLLLFTVANLSHTIKKLTKEVKDAVQVS